MQLLGRTIQEQFEIGLLGVLAQGRLSPYDYHGTCQYRGDGGVKCVFGHLIPDPDYRPSMENQSAWNVITNYHCELPIDKPTLRTGEEVSYLAFYDRLQMAHDSSAQAGGRDDCHKLRLGMFVYAMHRIAWDFNLHWPNIFAYADKFIVSGEYEQWMAERGILV